MAYTSVDKPIDHFNTITWTGDIQDSDGTGHDQSVTGIGFQPDWLWHKCTSHANQHMLVDSIRGTGGSPTQMLFFGADNTAETNSNTNGAIESIDSDGYTVTSGNDSSSKSNNAGANGRTYVAWSWKAGGASTSSNSDGSITSNVSANTTAGFSIVTWTGSGSGATIGHGLGVQPQIVFVKNRDDTSSWNVYTVIGGGGKGLFLNDTAAFDSDTSYFNNGTASTTTFPVGTANTANGSSDNMIAYCFANIKGYSKIGQYEGNSNANGSFVYLGFAPAWVMIKPVDAADNWVMFDNTRNNGDPNTATAPYLLYANRGFAQTTDTKHIDFLSNGFKIRSSGNTVNRSSTFVYMAFAKDSFVSSGGVPATAR